MTRREIAATLLVFTLIGGAIAGTAVYDLAACAQWSLWMLLWPAPVLVFVVVAVGLSYVQAFRELRRRNGWSA